MKDVDPRRSLMLKLLLSVSILFVITMVLLMAIFSYITDDKTTTFHINEHTDLNYSVVWGWGMSQRITLDINGRTVAAKTQEVFKKPYWSGGPLFADKHRSHYYVVLRYGAYDIDIDKGTMTLLCMLSANLVGDLEYLGQFSLKPISRDATQERDVIFTPAGQKTPGRSGVSADQREFKDLCG
ncbi:hypothetical protein ACN9MF_12845 [Methylobacterium fujisawaense]|uniref:hypothetical protein n=1 Tax=Methylobacterium fujisawaense TaxID=107400 RepID=UPI003CF576CD